MRILLDINIWLDIAARPKTFPQSTLLIHFLEKERHTIGFPLSGYTTFYYLLTNLTRKETALSFIKIISQRGIRMLPFTAEDISLAQSLAFNDHEDACIAAIALNQKYDMIATRNVKDFKNSPIMARTPTTIIRGH